jgi:hypothetical protein
MGVGPTALSSSAPLASLIRPVLECVCVGGLQALCQITGKNEGAAPQHHSP